MRIRVHAIRTLVVAVMLVAPAASLAKRAEPNRVTDLVATLKTGQWVQIHGVLMKDRTVQCTELKVLTGDFLDDDWGLTGQIEDVDVLNRRLSIGHIVIHVIENAGLEGARGRLKSLAEIKRGMIVEVGGTYLKDRAFFAKEVDDESSEIKFPSGERRLYVVGKIEQLNLGQRRIQAMGTVFVLTDKTQVKSLIR